MLSEKANHKDSILYDYIYIQYLEKANPYRHKVK